MYGESTDRKVDAEVPEGQVAEMDGVEHLGQYVYEMTQAKVKALKDGGGVLPPVARTKDDSDAEEEEDEDGGPEEVEEA